MSRLKVKWLSTLLAIAGSVGTVFGQAAGRVQIATANSLANGYSIALEPVSVEGFTGLQSFAAAQHDGKILLIGGRTDGLHRRQPFASFSPDGSNNKIVVLDPSSKETWSAAITDLPPELGEQLRSTNMEFIQRGQTLYLIGGYGYSHIAGDHVTYGKLTAVRVDCVIAALVRGGTMAGCFRQISDPIFAVTGGQIGRIGETYFLVGGQRFEGRYNPMGPNHGPGFRQQYTDQIRKFSIIDDGRVLRVENSSAVTDKANLHRRDFNMLPQIFANGVPGFTVFSGVFQIDADIPFTDTVDIFVDSHRVNPAFTQYLNHYHSAKAVLFDAAGQRTENIFFGGISQYEESAGTLVRNDDVPFTKIISKVARDKDGRSTEAKLGEMPGFLGAGAEFIVNAALPRYENDIVKSNELKGDRVLLGHIIGGIVSTQRSIFFSNTGNESSAGKTVFRVWLTRPAK
jgi:hypothetical protein